ncbi:MAG TPA: MotE family protein [Caulobacteraceae bacterium]|jgi:flagellar motility protein MotE (MotC chaperone)
MSRTRFLPVVLVVAGGALALRAMSGVADLPRMFDGAKAFAEEMAPKKAADPKAAAAVKDKAAVNALLAKPPAPPVSPTAAVAAPAAPAPQVCAPTPAELAKQAGMSPSELQVLQSLGARRTQLDAREQNLDTQLQLLAAAEAKVDTKLKQLASLKGDIQGLLGQADAKKDSELQRLVTIYEQMPPAAAAARMTLLDDAVRLPLAAKMNPRKLSAILAQMPAADAKTVTEKLADRLGAADAARQALASNAPTPAPAAPPAASATPAKGPAAPAAAPATTKG